MNPVGLSLGPLLFPWGGLILALSLAAGFFLLTPDRETAQDLFFPLVLWGLVGARIWHILTPPLSAISIGLTTSYYLTHPLDVLTFWTGGFGIPGALIGGGLALLITARKTGRSFPAAADLLTPGLVLALALGRSADWVNQQLYGLPSSLPWAIYIDPAHRLPGYEGITTYHPLFAYEMVLDLLIVIGLLAIARRHAEKEGILFLSGLALTSIARFFLEFLRLDKALVAGVNINQVFFGLAALGAFTTLLLKGRAAKGNPASQLQ